MVLNRQRGTVALLLLLAAACEAFTTIVVPPSVGRHQSVTTTAPARREFFASSWTRLQLSSEDSESNEEGGSNPDPAASAVDDDEVDEENETTDEDEEEEEEEEEQEDPELKALKEEIAQLEQDLKNARRKVADVGDRADDFTKTGYARRVAEMENMRRARSVRVMAFTLLWLGYFGFDYCLLVLSVLIFSFIHTDAAIIQQIRCNCRCSDRVFARLGQADQFARSIQRRRVWPKILGACRWYESCLYGNGCHGIHGCSW